MTHFKAPATPTGKKRIQWIISVAGILILFLSVCAQIPPLPVQAQQDNPTETPIPPVILEEILRFSVEQPIRQDTASRVVGERLLLFHENGALCVYDLTDQTQSWCYDALQSSALGGVDEAAVYLMGIDSATNQVRAIALDLATGNTLWQMDAGTYNEGQIACEGTLQVGKMFCSVGSVLFALDTKTPSILWTKDLENQLSAPFSSDGRVFIAAAAFYALDAVSGTILWQAEVNADSDIQPVASNGNVIAAGDDGSVTALNMTDGSVIWSHQLGENLCKVLTDESVLIAIGANAQLKRLDPASGDVLWEFGSETGADEHCPSAVLANGYLYLSRNDSEILVIDVDDGVQVLRQTAEAGEQIAALQAANERLYALFTGGSVVVYRQEPSVPQQPTPAPGEELQDTPEFSDGGEIGALATNPKVAAGRFHTCAITSSGGVKCWGLNESGQLGDGTTQNRSIPVDVVGLSNGVTAIITGSDHTCALTSSGGVKCWGLNESGQLGDETTTNHSTPVDVVGLSSGVTAVGAGFDHTCALTNAGGVKCWGSNWAGQLGDGTTEDRSTPVNVSGLSSGVAAIAVGYAHTCALTSSGGVKCWGWNDYGQLGDGTTESKSFPENVSGLSSGIAAIAAGEGVHTCALTSSGGVKCWGWNEYGQLGNGTHQNSSTPVNVSGLSSGVMALSAGGGHTCALTSSGGVKCWGDNYRGQLGDGTTTERPTPVNTIGLSSGMIAVEAGGGHTCALTGSGGVKCWGLNYNGQLGDGTTTNHSTPVNVVGFGGNNTYSISGRVVFSNATGLAGVTISTGSISAVTNENGSYTLSGLSAGSYTLTAEKPGYTFTPTKITVSVPPSTTGKNFTATFVGFTISGKVLDTLGRPVKGVIITDGAGHSVQTLNDGSYSFSGLLPGNYTLTPSQSESSFSPASRPVTLPPSATNQNFTADTAQSRALSRMLDVAENLTGAARKTITYLQDESGEILVGGAETGAKTLIDILLALVPSGGEAVQKTLEGVSESAVDAGTDLLTTQLTDLSIEIGTSGNWGSRWMEKALAGERQKITDRHDAFTDTSWHTYFNWNNSYNEIASRWRKYISDLPSQKTTYTLLPYPPYIILSTFNSQTAGFETVKTIFEALGFILQILVVVALVVVLIALIVATVSSGGVTLPLLIKAATLLFNIQKLLTLVKIAAGTMAFALALNIAGNAWLVVAPEVSKGHDRGLTELTSQIQNASGTGFVGLGVSASAEEDKTKLVTVLSNSEDAAVSPLVHTYIYDPAGHLVEILSYQPQIAAKSSTALSSELALPPGEYRVVSVIHTREVVGLAATPIQTFSIERPSLELEVSLADASLQMGEALTAAITLTNTGSQPSGHLLLSASPGKSDEGKSWEVDLSAGRTRTFSASFPVDASGALRVVVTDEWGVVKQVDRAFVVGENQNSLALNASPGQVFDAGADVSVSLNVENAGDVQANSTLSWKTIDVDDQSEVSAGSLALQTSAGGSENHTLTWLPAAEAEPGTYLTTLSLDGQFCRSFSYDVRAENVYYATLSLDENTVEAGQSIHLKVKVSDAAYAPVNADSVGVTIFTPGGASETISLTSTETGTYEGDYVSSLSGTYTLKTELTASGKQVFQDSGYFIATTASALNVQVSGDAAYLQLSPLTITVTNEHNAAVPEAWVTLQNGDELLSGRTDAEGKITLNVYPKSMDDYQMSVTKPGFVGFTDTLEVIVASDTTPPPLVVNAVEATNQSEVEIKGKTEIGASVQVAGQAVSLDAQGNFSAWVGLSPGENVIEVTASDASANTTQVQKVVNYDTTPPVITISSPEDGAYVGKPVLLVNGSTEPGLPVEVNGVKGKADNDGNYSLMILLTEGENRITASTQDAAGNPAQTSRTVYYYTQPVLSRLSPAWVEINRGAFTLSVYGVNFSPGSVVRWDGAALSTTRIGDTELSAEVPAEQVVAGIHLITVDDGSQTSNALPLTVHDPDSRIPVPLSPARSEVLKNWLPQFRWNGVNNVTQYQIQVLKGTAQVALYAVTPQSAGCSEGLECSFVSTKLMGAGPYQWRVRTVSPAGYGPWSALAAFNTPAKPAATVLVAPVNGDMISNWQPIYTWERVPDALSYRLQVFRGSTAVVNQIVTAQQAGCAYTTLCAFKAPRMLGKGPYTWKIQAINPSGAGPYSAVGLFNTPPAPADMAVLLTPAADMRVPNWQPKYEWLWSQGATQYRFEVWKGGTRVGAQWITAKEAGCTTDNKCEFTPGTVLGSGTYKWRIQAVNPSGASLWSNWATFITPAKGIPADKVTPLSPLNGATLNNWQPTYRWKGMLDVSRYNLEVWIGSARILAKSITPAEAGCSAGSNCSFTNTALLKSGAYRWRVQAVNPAGKGPWSDWQTFATPAKPNAVGLVSPIGGSPVSNWMPEYRWQRSAGATAYTIEVWRGIVRLAAVRVTSADAKCTLDGPCRYTVLKSLARGPYTWRVRAENPSGISYWSEWGSFNTPPAPAAVTELTAPAEGQVINTWQPEYRWTGVDGATAYYLQVLRGSSTVLSVKVSAEKAGCTVAGSTCAYRAEKVLALGPYKWRVMAENPSGKSAWSVLVNFNTLPKPGVIATLGMPEGEINDHQPVYSWTKPDENATGFILEVWRGSSLVFRQWITPANAGCASDAGCDYKPSTTLVNGTYRWRVSGVNPSGAGPWSALKTFTVTSP